MLLFILVELIFSTAVFFLWVCKAMDSNFVNDQDWQSSEQLL